MGWPSRSIRRLRALSRAELALLAEAWLSLAWVDLNIRFLPYSRWRHWLAADPAEGVPGVGHAGAESLGRLGGKDSPGQLAKVAMIIRLAEIAARHHWTLMNCLRRSLAQRHMLARRGISTRLHIGVRPDPGGALAAHAWLSSRGHVLNDTEGNVAQYRELSVQGWEVLPAFD